MDPKVYRELKSEDLLWFLSRMSLENNCLNVIQANQQIPPWSAFNSVLVKDERERQTADFFPVHPHPITDYSTVYTYTVFIMPKMYCPNSQPNRTSRLFATRVFTTLPGTFYLNLQRNLKESFCYWEISIKPRLYKLV